MNRFAPLAMPRFRAFFVAGMLSFYGDYLTVPALVIITYRLAGDLGVSLLFIFQTAPLLLLLPVGGNLGDRGDRRRRLIALDLVRAALAALMVAAAHGGILLLVLLGTCGSRTATALYEPGRRRLIPILLPQELTPSGSSLISLVGDSSILVGPALGALLLLFIPPTALVAIDGVTFLLSAVLTYWVGPQPAIWRKLAPQHPLRNLRRGFDLLLLDGTTRLFAIQALLGAATASIIQVYFVELARQVLHLPTTLVGLMYIIVGGSSLIGSSISIRIPMVRRRGLLVVGYAHLVVAILVGETLGAPAMIAALAVFAMTGALQEVWGFNRIQTTTQSEGVGQAMGAGLWCFFFGRALGAAVAAVATARFSRAEFMTTFVLVAVCACLVASFAGVLRGRRDTASWPPGGPPLPF